MAKKVTLKSQSAIWWARTKKSDALTTLWLQKQFMGEARAAARLKAYLDKFNLNTKVRKIVQVIAMQEGAHAGWIADLLQTRKALPDLDHEDRYWKHTLKNIKSFDDMCGVAWAAENMRLVRIRTIVEDTKAPKDIRSTFQKILKDEIFHEKAFRALSSTSSKKKALVKHSEGMKAIGLFA